MDQGAKPDDEELWAREIAGIEPLPDKPRVTPPPAPLRHARQSAADEAQVMPDALFGDIDPADFDSGDETEFRAGGVNRRQLRRLRRGEFAIQGSVDLHGQTRIEAAQSVRALLARAEVEGWRCIKIIHGKGLRSPQGRPVLKSRVELALQRSDCVLAYASAPPWAGGSGAILALLRAPRPGGPGVA